MKNSYHIIIIGAGVIGLTQAVALAQEGFKVALVDQGSSPPHLTPDFDSRVFALDRSSQRLLEALGLWPLIKKQRMAEYPTVRLAIASLTPNLVFHAHEDCEPNLGHVVEQKIWKQAALQRLEEESSCDFFWEYTLERYQEGEALLMHRGTRHVLTADLILAADGPSSAVKTQAGIATDTFHCHQTALIGSIKTEKNHSFEAHQYFGPHGICAFLPLAHPHYYSIVWTIADEQLTCIQALDSKAIAEQLAQITHHAWGELEMISSTHFFPLIQRQAKVYVQERLALIGDAAHVIHPLAGQGANLGCADIALLTECLQKAARKNRPLGALNHLLPYQRARRSSAWRMMGMMRAFQKLQTIPSSLISATHCGVRTINNFPCLKNSISRFALYKFTQ